MSHQALLLCSPSLVKGFSLAWAALPYKEGTTLGIVFFVKYDFFFSVLVQKCLLIPAPVHHSLYTKDKFVNLSESVSSSRKTQYGLL